MIAELEQYFPNVNEPIVEGQFTFLISLFEEEETFIVNLKIKQRDKKEDHLIKFRIYINTIP